jgi:hypothetical protein
MPTFQVSSLLPSSDENSTIVKNTRKQFPCTGENAVYVRAAESIR